VTLKQNITKAVEMSPAIMRTALAYGSAAVFILAIRAREIQDPHEIRQLCHALVETTRITIEM
jgi:hypothetical protein